MQLLYENVESEMWTKTFTTTFLQSYLMDSNEESGNGVTLVVHFNLTEMRLSLTRAMPGKKTSPYLLHVYTQHILMSSLTSLLLFIVPFIV